MGGANYVIINDFIGQHYYTYMHMLVVTYLWGDTKLSLLQPVFKDNKVNYLFSMTITLPLAVKGCIFAKRITYNK